jgi:hypothetical protein
MLARRDRNLGPELAAELLAEWVDSLLFLLASALISPPAEPS